MEKSQYKSLTEWRKEDPKAYEAAYRLNMIAEIAKKFGWSYRVGNFLPFEEAKKFVHTLNLKSQKEWENYCKNNKPDNIPTSPYYFYKNKGWVSFGDWLGYSKNFLSFEEARKFIHILKLKGDKEWREYCKSGNKPDNIPIYPERVYKNDGWLSIGDWLGTYVISTKKKSFLSFEKARKFVHTLNLKSQKKWKDYCKSGNKPDNIPTCPDKTYKDKGWVSIGDWLGK